MSRSFVHAALAAGLFGAVLVAQSSPPLAAGPELRQSGQLLRLRYGVFDPLRSVLEVPVALRSTAAQQLRIVQFVGAPAQADRDAIAATGSTVLGYLPDNAYVVRVAASQVEALRGAAAVRWIGDYHPAYRLEPELRRSQVHAQPEARRYHVVVTDKHVDKPVLRHAIEALGGRVAAEHAGSPLLEVALTGPQLLAAAGLDQVLWIDRCTEVGLDMDNARIQGGANYIEAQAGYTGSGVNAHVYEGIEAAHPDFPGVVVNVLSGGAATAHGHCTAGILFGSGISNPAVRGMAPDCGKFYTNFNTPTASRWQVFSDLVNVHDVSLTTASWGSARTAFYTSISAESDALVFDHDLAWTQAQGSGPLNESRPQAWAKNVFSIGGVFHGDDSNPANDSCNSSGASTGPAADGRIKPTFVAYADSVGTSDLMGAAGYSPLDWFANFGGSSASTPMVGGHLVLAIQMFTDDTATPGFGLFGNALRVPAGTAHQNRPHFPTLKALMVATAAQYAFTAASFDNRRECQGWGFPDLRAMYDNRDKTFVVDEQRVLTQGGTDSWSIAVALGEPSLRICLSWNEPPGNPAAAQSLVNNLSLLVTAPNGATFWGNHGLDVGVWSVPGGSEDTVNSLESVFVQNPQPGSWLVEVVASAVVMDNHVETAAVDADYGLVVSGGTGAYASATSVGAGCGGPPAVALAASARPLVGTTIDLDTTDVPAGTLLALSIASLTEIDPAFDLTSLGMPGCELYQTLELLTPFATSGGVGSIALSIPNAPSLAGTVVLDQTATLTPGINAFGFVTSNGLQLTIGVL